MNNQKDFMKKMKFLFRTSLLLTIFQLTFFLFFFFFAILLEFFFCIILKMLF